ncbi:MAG: integrin [Comamonadaceae bacterium]|nr:MAG: integrin [Comamonadaceae bacterium]
MRRLLPAFVLVVSSLVAACGGSGGEAPVVPPGAVTFSVGGQLDGLGAGKMLVLADAGGQSASLAANGAYSLRLPAGTAYSLRVAAQPPGQTCTVANGSGTANADIGNISVTCADDLVPPEAKPVSGTIAGLGSGKTLVLQLTANGSIQEATVAGDGSFSFAQAITGSYTVTVKTPPAAQGCTVANGQGTAGSASTFTVTCVPLSASFKLGGTVSGNLGVVALRNTVSGETIALNSNGAFSFTQPVLQGGSYSVSVFDQSASQTCSVANGSGTATADTGNIQVSCSAVVVVAPPAVFVPSMPASVTITYNTKSWVFGWGTVTAPVGGGPVSYRLFEDADGAGPAASTQVASIPGASTVSLVLNGLLHTRLNAQYQVQACNSAGCSTATAAITPNLTQAIGYLKASNTAAGDEFGSAMALSADGTTLAVGARNRGSQAGAVYVFTRLGGTWLQQAYLQASNAEADDFFGASVALSANGNTLAVGAFGEDSAATGVNGNQADNSASLAGAAYVFTRGGGAWSQQAYLKASNAGANDFFGVSVGLSNDGDTLAVGAYRESGNATGVNGNQADNSAVDAGAAYVFTRSAGNWSQQAYVKASNTAASDQFGLSIALSGDGNTLVAGARGEDSSATGVNGNQADNAIINAGAVYVFTRSGGAWSQQAYVKASNSGAFDLFGQSLALSGDGETLAVGTDSEDSNATGINGNQADNSASTAGAVYVFTRSAGAWSQQAYVKASTTDAFDYFGYSMALSADGSTLAMGALGESSNATGINGNQANNSASQAGAAWLFTRSAGAWSQQAYLKAGNTGANDQFGTGVALSGDGNTLAVSAIGESSNATGTIGNQADNSASFSGAVYIY